MKKITSIFSEWQQRPGVRRKLIWGSLGLVAVLLRFFLKDHPEWVETYYSRGIFLGVRWLIDYFFAWFPVPLIYLFFFFLLLFLFIKTRRLVTASVSWRQKLARTGLSLFAFSGGAAFAFLILWGYNYSRVPIEKQLGIAPAPLSLDDLREELELETEKIVQLRRQIPGASARPLAADLLPEDMETLLRKAQEEWLNRQGFPTLGRVRAKKIYPSGIFLRFSSSGLYFPYTGEGHVDAGVHPLQLPFVMAHEMGHGYGFGDEGTCNFLAYITCIRSSNPYIAYAGHFNYWRSIAVNYLRYEPEAYRQYRNSLPPGIQADLNSVNESLDRYPDILPTFRYYAYDAYLKSQGIKEGIQNYSRVLMLVHAWREEN